MNRLRFGLFRLRLVVLDAFDAGLPAPRNVEPKPGSPLLGADLGRQVLCRSCEAAAHRYLESLGPDASEKMAVSTHLAQTGRNLDDPVLARSYFAKAAATWSDIPTTAAIRREVDWLEKRATADREDEKFAAECRSKAAELRRAAGASSDYVVSRNYEVAAALLEQDAVQGKAAQAERLASAASRERDAEKRAIETWRWQGERNR